MQHKKTCQGKVINYHYTTYIDFLHTARGRPYNEIGMRIDIIIVYRTREEKNSERRKEEVSRFFDHHYYYYG